MIRIRFRVFRTGEALKNASQSWVLPKYDINGYVAISATCLSRFNVIFLFQAVGWGVKPQVVPRGFHCFFYPAFPVNLAAANVLPRLLSAVMLHLAPDDKQSLSGKIAAHYSAAAGLFSRERAEVTGSLDRAAASVATAEAPGNVVAEDGEGSSNPRPPLPPSAAGSLGSGGPSPWVR